MSATTKPRRRSPGRRRMDLSLSTRVLSNLAVITGAIVSAIYAYGFGQQSNDPLTQIRDANQRMEQAKQARDAEEKLKALSDKLDALMRKGAER